MSAMIKDFFVDVFQSLIYRIRAPWIFQKMVSIVSNESYDGDDKYEKEGYDEYRSLMNRFNQMNATGIGFLRKKLRSMRSKNRYAAAFILGKTISALSSTLTDSKPNVRYRAALSLRTKIRFQSFGNNINKDSVDKLITLIGHGERELCENVYIRSGKNVLLVGYNKHCKKRIRVSGPKEE